MKKFAFISRHEISDRQRQLAAAKNIELVPVGDRDAFAVNRDEFVEFDGAIVVHPAMALRLIDAGFEVGIFKNANRAPEGERPSFEAESLHVFFLRFTVM